jgi:hypothetical protein
MYPTPLTVVHLNARMELVLSKSDTGRSAASEIKESHSGTAGVRSLTV